MRRAAAVMLACGAACGPPVPVTIDAAIIPQPDASVACMEETTRCVGQFFERCVEGTWVTVQPCGGVCDDVAGCVFCHPGEGACDGDLAQRCADDGSGWLESECDSLQGILCDPSIGLCTGACLPANLGVGSLGCDFYPTVTINGVDHAAPFGIAVSNPGPDPATITVESTVPAETFVVPAGAIVTHDLPWVNALQLCGSHGCSLDGSLVPHGAARVRSTRPVAVHQFSPTSGEPFGTAEASLLLPSQSLGTTYVVAGFAGPGSVWRAVTVNAAHDDTEVTIRPTAPVYLEGTYYLAGDPISVTLMRRDAVQIAGDDGDLTGTIIEASRPVQAFAAAFLYSASNSDGVGSDADDLQDVLLPIDHLGTEYVVLAPRTPDIVGADEHLIRIVAVEPGITSVVLDPPLAGGVPALAGLGAFFDVPVSDADLVVQASARVIVAQVMADNENLGAPSQLNPMPARAFTREHRFYAPSIYLYNDLTIAGPVGATVTVDGFPVDLAPIGGTAWGGAVVPVAAGGHVVQASAPVGISAYGTSYDFSCWYATAFEIPADAPP
jgi:hypothetical protein